MNPAAFAKDRLLRALRLYTRYAPMSAGRERIAERVLVALQEVPSVRVASTKAGPRLLVATGDLVQAYIYLFGVWEPDITRWVMDRLGPGDTFVDVGANIGYYSVLASRLVGNGGSVVAVEASAHFASTLRRNLELNGCANARVVNIAASAGSGARIPFYQPEPHNLGITTGVLAGRDLQVSFMSDTASLSDILTAEECERARLIKVDVEGLELAVLRGLVPALAQARPDLELIVEVSPELLSAQGYAASDVMDLLARQGYHAYRIPNDYRMSGYLTRRPPGRPRRWTVPVTREGDFVFSRTDVEVL